MSASGPKFTPDLKVEPWLGLANNIRARGHVVNPYRLGNEAGTAGLDVRCPYTLPRSAKLFKEGVAYGITSKRSQTDSTAFRILLDALNMAAVDPVILRSQIVSRFVEVCRDSVEAGGSGLRVEDVMRSVVLRLNREGDAELLALVKRVVSRNGIKLALAKVNAK